MGILPPFAPRGVQYSGEIRFNAPQDVLGTGDLCRMHPAAVRPERTRQSSGTARVGIVEGSCGYRAHRVSIRGTFIISRNPGYKTRGVAMKVNVVLTPPGSLSRSQSLGTGPNASCRYSCPICSTRVHYSGEIRFVESQRVNGYRRPPTAVRHGEARQSSGTGQFGDCRRIL